MPRQLHRTIRCCAAVMMALGLLATTAVASASPAHAESSSAWSAQYPWPHNGCTSVPDSPFGLASFTYACNHHDGCYAGHWASKWTCDQWFLNDMNGACVQANWWFAQRLTTCFQMAAGYWTGVRLFGQKYYDSNGVLSRISTPMNTA